MIVDDNVGTPEQWEGVTGQKGMAGITVLRLATRHGTGVGFSDEDERFELREGRLRHRGAFYGVADMLAESTADRYARAIARWSPMSADELSGTDSQGGELLRALGINDPRALDVDQLWAESRGRGDPKWAMVPVGVKPGGELQYIVLRAKDFGGFGFHSVVIGTSGSGKSEYFLSLCNGIALTHSPETFIVIFVDMKFESAAQDLEGLPHVAGSLSNLGKDDRHLAERMRKAVDGEIARRYRLFKDAGARDANEYEEMRLAGRDLEPVPILLVIIDEYLELFHHHPEWIDLVIHIGQEGRGCNVFFTLGGQRLDLSSLSKAKSNFAFRVALRAETAEDSRDVISSDAALHLPSKEAGYALLKVGPRDLEPFRCFYVSAPFVVPKKAVNVDKTVDVSFTQPRSLTWEYQPLTDRGQRRAGRRRCARRARRIPLPRRRFQEEEAARRDPRVAARTQPGRRTRSGCRRWRSVRTSTTGAALAGQALACRLRTEPRPGVSDRRSWTSRRTTRSACTPSTPRWTTSWWSPPRSAESRRR